MDGATAIRPETTSARWTSFRKLWPFIAIWALACLILLAANYPAISTLEFPDPDDALRLQEVRDWIGGQGWFDVSQHRMNVPSGGDMHWSRLVDVPLALAILLLRPILGQAGAEVAAMVVVPLITLGVVMGLVAAVTSRLMDREHALLAAFITPVSFAITHQLRPLRIDHHGWQMACAVAVLLALLGERRKQSGWLAGVALAFWLHISLEGLPFAAAVAVLLAVRWMLDAREGDRLVATMTSLTAGSLVLFALTRSFDAWSRTYCDAISPLHLGIFAFGALTCFAITRVNFSSLLPKLACFAIAGAAAAGAMALLAPQCASGPFGQLGPLGRDLWYLRVTEGLPVWRQTPLMIGWTIAFPLVGIVGTVLALRRSARDRRKAWATTLVLLAAATAMAVLVQRSSGYAHLLALPGGAFLFRTMINHARNQGPVGQIGISIAAIALLAPAHVTAAVAIMMARQSNAPQGRPAALCSVDEFRALNRLAPADVAAPLEIGTFILARTHHRIIASGYHRSAGAIEDDIRIFVEQPAEARRILRARSIDYLVVCPGLPEPGVYREAAPSGLWADLDAGRAFAWLEPVRIPGVVGLQVWRVRQ